MTMDKAKGKGKEIVGEAKERVGKATGDEEMDAEGGVDKAEGKAQGVVGKAKDKLDDVKRKVS
jgi:uncharacterized protein YjbJ (UPF0337 family)